MSLKGTQLTRASGIIVICYIPLIFPFESVLNYFVLNIFFFLIFRIIIFLPRECFWLKSWLTPVMTQASRQVWWVQNRTVLSSAAFYSRHISTRPLSLSHNISTQQHPAPHWAVITGNTATPVSECVLLYPRALGAASLENELWRGWLGPRWSQADRQVIYSCTVHTSLGSYRLSSCNREICPPLRENKEVEDLCVCACVCLWICDECSTSIRWSLRSQNRLGVITLSVDPHDCSAPCATRNQPPC